MSLVLKNARIIHCDGAGGNSESRSQTAAKDASAALFDIVISGDRIESIMPSGRQASTSKSNHAAATGAIADAERAQTIDARGAWLMPGLVDLHTHLRDFNQGAKEDIASGTRAAAAGGYTTVVAMANTSPPIDNTDILRELLDLIAERAVVRVLPVANVTRGMAGKEITDMALLKDLGVVCFSDDGLPVTNLAVLKSALLQCKMLETFIVSHPEDRDLSGPGVLNEGPASLSRGLAGVPTASESACIAREIEVVRYTGGRLHFAHVSAAASIKLIERAKEDGLPVTADTTPHHLTLTDCSIVGFDTRYKMNPPLRSKADQEALVKALASGVLDCVATDHAPHTAREKASGFDKAPCGITGLEIAFAITHERLKGYMSAEKIAALFCLSPRRILGLPAPRIVPGAVADLHLFDPESRWIYDPAHGESKSHNSPFAGREITGRTLATICGGKLVYRASAGAD